MKKIAALMCAVLCFVCITLCFGCAKDGKNGSDDSGKSTADGINVVVTVDTAVKKAFGSDGTVSMTIPKEQYDLLLGETGQAVQAKLVAPTQPVTAESINVLVATADSAVFGKYKSEEKRPFAAFAVVLTVVHEDGTQEAPESLPQGVTYSLVLPLPLVDTACDDWAVASSLADESGIETLKTLEMLKVRNQTVTVTSDRVGTHALVGLIADKHVQAVAGFSWWLFIPLVAGIVLIAGSVLALSLVWRQTDNRRGRACGIAALVLGIVAAVVSVIALAGGVMVITSEMVDAVYPLAVYGGAGLSVALAVLAVVLGTVADKRGYACRITTAGRVLGVLVFLPAVAAAVLCALNSVL